MKATCVGIVLCALIGLFAAGCGEVSSTAQQSVGQLGGSTNEKTTPPSDAGTANDKPAGEAAAKAESGATDPALKPDVTANATLSAPDQRAAAAAKSRHLGPQLVTTGGDGRARNVSFDDIKFPMEDPKSRMFKREMLSESIEQLGGKRIRIRGFILPGALDEFTHFVLVRDNMECCFGPGAAIYDSIMVDMDESSGKTVKFTTRPVTVEGEFVVKELIGPDDKHWSIYHITATKVE
jgi:hypothetical protein